MLLLTLIAAAAAQPAELRPRAVVHATATVRIISGSRVTLGAPTPQAQLRTTSVADHDGRQAPAQLIEFH